MCTSLRLVSVALLLLELCVLGAMTAPCTSDVCSLLRVECDSASGCSRTDAQAACEAVNATLLSPIDISTHAEVRWPLPCALAHLTRRAGSAPLSRLVAGTRAPVARRVWRLVRSRHTRGCHGRPDAQRVRQLGEPQIYSRENTAHTHAPSHLAVCCADRKRRQSVAW